MYRDDEDEPRLTPEQQVEEKFDSFFDDNEGMIHFEEEAQ